jgi:glucosamine--fructose-6-phosphate aminotransferase (isomerizing)
MTTQLERQIRSQPAELESLIASNQTREQVRIAAEGLQRANRLWVVGAGSSLHAAEIGALMLAEAGRGAVVVPTMRFVTMAPVIGPQDAIIVITHSGETAYALAARALAVTHGIDTLTITRSGAGFPHSIETVPRETSETHTVSYSATLCVFAMLARDLGAESIGDDELAQISVDVAHAVEAPGIAEIPLPRRVLMFTGSAAASITAREAALKSREAARVPAEGFDIEAVLHGQAAPLDGRDGIVTLGPPEDPLTDAVATTAAASGVTVTQIAEPSTLPSVLPQIPLGVRTQMLALSLAERAGTDPDTVRVGPWAEPDIWKIGLP